MSASVSQIPVTSYVWRRRIWLSWLAALTVTRTLECRVWRKRPWARQHMDSPRDSESPKALRILFIWRWRQNVAVQNKHLHCSASLMFDAAPQSLIYRCSTWICGGCPALEQTEFGTLSYCPQLVRYLVHVVEVRAPKRVD